MAKKKTPKYPCFEVVDMIDGAQADIQHHQRWHTAFKAYLERLSRPFWSDPNASHARTVQIYYADGPDVGDQRKVCISTTFAGLKDIDR